MNSERRDLLKFASAVTAYRLAAAAGLLVPSLAFAEFENSPAQFDAKSMDEFYKTLKGELPQESQDVKVIAPDIAENGAVVPLGAMSSVLNTSEMYLLIANNPAVLSSKFLIPQGTDAEVNIRVKMNKTGDVFAMVKSTDGKYYFAKKEVKVTLGGCGG
ncbi:MULTISPECIES: thiosulfate oxidation carrier protein SoxY [Limnobacter]|uniref:Thiosulfate oxidation carrier protein SoxY n=1 Tax=Limnobacter litoralis TaxID=481366 RepID=A0ABQ5YUM7_9BURK|nr:MULTISPECIES: thiosulfate oxidation carrier protein SoxY [Limnobacter]GLR26464.1 thiosulfate oxidation carrier protein SoxY [Limnobacter litoralis]HEX5486837.1 thiosulfate oxidation carrier protein SoxY [Limnobacter sp.]